MKATDFNIDSKVKKDVCNWVAKKNNIKILQINSSKEPKKISHRKTG